MKKYLIIITLFFLFVPKVFSGEAVLIINSSCKATTITKKLVKEVYLGKKRRWDYGKKIVPVLVGYGGDVHKAFLRDILEIKSSKFDMYWKKRLFSGKGKPLKSFTSEKEVIKYIASHPGAIGYVFKDVYEFEMNGDVKILPIYDPLIDNISYDEW